MANYWKFNALLTVIITFHGNYVFIFLLWQDFWVEHRSSWLYAIVFDSLYWLQYSNQHILFNIWLPTEFVFVKIPSRICQWYFCQSNLKKEKKTVSFCFSFHVEHCRWKPGILYTVMSFYHKRAGKTIHPSCCQAVIN